MRRSGQGRRADGRRRAPKTIVEHTSINPNKAAHIGHLRNAVLGDTFARLLRYAGRRVEVQNYIDNTGVQVADVVLGFLHLEPKSLDEVRKLAAAPRFDYLCWDLYARVTQFLAEDKSRLELRGKTLKEIEEGHGEAAQMAEVVATAIVLCHLRTLDRLGIDYDLLTRESEILHLKFWDAAFEMLKERGAIQLATEGKNAGCWVMELARTRGKAKQRRSRRQRKQRRNPRRKPRPRSSFARTAPSPTSARTSPTISGNSGCCRAISTTSLSTSIRTATRSGPPRASRARMPRRALNLATRTKCST